MTTATGEVDVDCGEVLHTLEAALAFAQDRHGWGRLNEKSQEVYESMLKGKFGRGIVNKGTVLELFHPAKGKGWNWQKRDMTGGTS